MFGTFTYANPTRLHFGEDALDALHEELPKDVACGERGLIALAR